MAKIVIIHHSGIIGGAGVSLINTIKALAPHHNLTVLLSNSPNDILLRLTDLQKDYNFKLESYGRRIGAITFYNGGDKFLSKRFLYRISLILKQWRFWRLKIKKLNPDVVITNSVILSWMSLLPEVKTRKSICFVRETICGNVKTPVNKLIRRLLCKFTKVVYISEFDRLSWNFDQDKSSIIRNFINESELDNSITRETASTAFELNSTSFHILYVGGVSYMKGFDIAVKATLTLNKEINTELLVAGVDFTDRKEMGGGKLSKYEEEILQFIQRSEYSSKIHLIGRQSDMSNCYAAADVLLFPMRSAHQARPVFEAGYYSLPAVISDFPNIKEDVHNSVNGVVFIPGDVADLVEKLKHLANDYRLRRRLGVQNKEMTLKNHSESRNAELITHLVENIL